MSKFKIRVMQIGSPKWLVFPLLCLTGCSTYDASLLEAPLDSEVMSKPFDSGATSSDASFGQLDSSVDQRTGFGDVFVPIDVGGDGEPLDASDDARLMDVMAPELDATIDAETQDAETQLDSAVDTGQETGLPACQGVRLFDLCWYLTDTEQSCEELCAEHEGYNPDTADYVGSTDQGGSEENCGDVLNALGFSTEVSTGNRTDGIGVGCHLWDSAAWWLSSPDFGADVSYPQVRIACACLE